MTPSFQELFGLACRKTGFFSNLSKRYLHLLVEDNGRIVEVSDKWGFAFHSMVHELKRGKNIGAHFHIGNESLGQMAGLTPDTPTLLLYGKNSLSRVEEPDRFYTSFPSTVLYLFRAVPGLLYGALKVTGPLPNIFPQRPDGVVYIDSEDRLAGFNRAFSGFFSDKLRDPKSMLQKPAADFLSPTPLELQKQHLSRTFPPEPSLLETLYENDFRRTRALSGVTSPAPDALSLTAGGLLFSNPTRDDLHFTLPAAVDTRRDFFFEMDLSPVRRETPLFAMGDADFAGFGPDANGYLIGPDYAGERYVLKRKGLAQKAGAKIARGETIRFHLAKTGQAFHLRINGAEALAFFDFNFLRNHDARVHVFLRIESACLIRSVKLSATREIPPPPLIEPPLTRLKTPERQAFLINPVDSLSFTADHSGINAYILENVTEMQKRVERLESENRSIRRAAGHAAGPFVGSGPKITAVREIALRAARSEATVLIQGETGTGKEVLARFIHENSERKNGPFVKVDCSALPANLMESELFGHEKGAFTGAAERREGHLEQAGGGTLLLDEAGSLSLSVQAKLLHFMQDHSITRVGGRTPISLNIRIIVASNADLKGLVHEGAFRQDLYYRIEVVTVTIPSLRERREDIPDLCRHFIASANARHHRAVRDFSSDAYEKIYTHPWPGNIRELRNAVERAVIFSDADFIPAEKMDLGSGVAPAPPGRTRKEKRPLKGIDGPALKALFQKHRGVAQKVADDLAVSRRALYYKIKSLGISAEKMRAF